jgi:hypothetical protein
VVGRGAGVRVFGRGSFDVKLASMDFEERALRREN